MEAEQNGGPPTEGLVRAVLPGMEFREADEEEGRTLTGHFAVTDVWTEINSLFEGHFLERFAAGAFKKTLREGFDQIKVLFQHGRDRDLGDKPIAKPTELREDDTGAFYEARLFDGLPELFLDGLRAGAYGASFRFRILREEFVEEPKASAFNPKGLPERTVKEAQVMEFGPVTFPAYPAATAGVRSLTDRYLADEMFARNTELLDEVLAAMVAARQEPALNVTGRAQDDAPSTPDAGDSLSTSVPERRVPSTDNLYGLGRQERRPEWAL